MGLFMTSADQMYGPITMLCHDNCLMKHIPWTVFKMMVMRLQESERCAVHYNNIYN
jgi:hypothetical protein